MRRSRRQEDRRYHAVRQFADAPYEIAPTNCGDPKSRPLGTTLRGSGPRPRARGVNLLEQTRPKEMCPVCGINETVITARLRTKGRVPNTYQITAYRQFSPFAARIVFNKLLIFQLDTRIQVPPPGTIELNTYDKFRVDSPGAILPLVILCAGSNIHGKNKPGSREYGRRSSAAVWRAFPGVDSNSASRRTGMLTVETRENGQESGLSAVIPARDYGTAL